MVGSGLLKSVGIIKKILAKLEKKSTAKILKKIRDDAKLAGSGTELRRKNDQRFRDEHGFLGEVNRAP